MSPEKLFGTDGIRGLVGEKPFEKKNLKTIGDFSSFILKYVYNIDKVVIGYDTRESSEWIFNIISKSFLQNGYDVYFVNVFTTAGVAFLCKKLNAIGVVISASHNPYQYNGIKFLSPFGTKIPTDIEAKIESAIKNKISLPKKPCGTKKLIDYKTEAENLYKDFLIEKFKNSLNIETPINKLSLLIDCANGAASKIAQDVFNKIFLNVKFINTTPNGKNINDNCGALYPEILKKYLKKSQIGITFDGDADRVIFLDEYKVVRDGDYIIGILATEYKKNKNLKNSLVVVTQMSNLGLLKYLWKKNIKVIQCPVGDKYVSEYLENYKGNLGGEQSGHIVLRDFLPTGDGILTSLEVLKVILKNKTTLHKLCQIFEKYPQAIKNVKTEKKPPLEKIFSEKFIKELEYKIKGRIVLRYSGTEPLFRIMIEAKDKNKIDKTAKIIEKKFLEYIEKN